MRLPKTAGGRVLLATVSGVLLFCIVLFANVTYVRRCGSIFDGIEFSPAYTGRGGELLHASLTGDDKYRIYKPVTAYPPQFLEAVLMQEDRYFYSHRGINPAAVLRAGWETYVKRSRRIGASTITMQVARLKYGLYTKSIPGKISQILRALYLELCFSKKDILDAYVNLAPCGGNIEGFETASWFYFNKPIEQTTLPEHLLLAVIPQNPIKRAPKPNLLPDAAKQARRVLFDSWIKEYPQDASSAVAMELDVTAVCSMPARCPHLARKLASSDKPEENGLFKNPRGIVRTTIDIPFQTLCEELLTSYIDRNKRFGVHNASMMLLDYDTMEVLASIGSADYFNDEIEGQVDGTISKRSPGSTLKPFIYAMALEQGLIHYDTMLKDTHVSFNEYTPDNYGSVFKGPVKAWNALVDSRNIPAIALASQLHDPDLYDFMVKTGVSGMKDRDHYGLSIVLGSAEVTMRELVKLYAVIANKGIERELRFVFGRPELPSEKDRGGVRRLSEASAFITKKMLEQNIAPYEYRPRETKDIPIGYKTGTSVGFKDSWTVAVFGRYILCVWIGNFDGLGNNAFLGRTMAAPLAFNIADAVLARSEALFMQDLFYCPDTVSQIQVCAVSGNIANDDCPRLEAAWFIPGVSPITSCKIHRKIYVDSRTGYRTDDQFSPYAKAVVREFWPSDLQQLFRQAGLPRLPPPEYPPEESRYGMADKGYPPEIISPMAGITYVYRPSDLSKNTLSLIGAGDADTAELFWYCDQNFIGKTKPGESVLWNPGPGVYDVTAADSQGRASSVWVKIETEAEINPHL